MLEKKRIKLNDIYAAYDELIADPQDGTYDFKKKREKLGYHLRLRRMIAKVKKETKWRDIFKIVAAAQKRLK